jgi:hypothetical protein
LKKEEVIVVQEEKYIEWIDDVKLSEPF